MTRCRHLTELVRRHGLTIEVAHRVELRQPTCVRDTWEGRENRHIWLLLLLLFTAKGVVVGDGLRPLRRGRSAPTVVRTWPNFTARRCLGLLLLLLLLAVEMLRLQHLLILHPRKLILLLLVLLLLLVMLLGVHVRIVTGRRLAKRLRLELTAEHGWGCAMLEVDG